jgi:NDP-sugar pyrophosphorylase family protein
MSVRVRDHIESAGASILAELSERAPWDWTQNAEGIVRRLIGALGADYVPFGSYMAHQSARIEPGAQIKGPAIIGPDCFIASAALIRGGCWLDARCILGPGAELKSSFLFAGAKLAHLNFVGDSVIGADVNLEAGAMIANYRNESADKRIRVRRGDALIDTGVEKFGALVGDNARIGANAVLAPGTLLEARTIVPRLGLVDQA